MEWIALIPFILIFVLLVFLRIPAIKAMPIIFLATLITAFYWGMTNIVILASLSRALLIFLEVFLLILLAVTLLNTLIKQGHIKKIENYLASISKDKKVQAMLIAWAFVALIEGAAGFGTPAALAAPFLLALGFPAITAITIALIGDSTAVTFGAAGTPIIIGLEASGLSQSEITQSFIMAAGIHLILASVATIAIAYFVSKTNKEFFSFIPFAVFSALSFAIPFYLAARYIGPELPSIIGGVFAIVLISVAARKGFLTEKNTQKLPKGITKALLPFIFLIGLLIISRNIDLIKDFLLKVNLGFENIFSTGIAQNFFLFYTPAFFFLVTIFVFSTTKKESLTDAFDKIKYPMVALLLILGVAQILLNSSININGFTSMPGYLATLLAGTGSFFTILSPFIGYIGSFVAGSATVSNVLFSSLQVDTALTLGLSTVAIIALQLVGSAAGNMIAVHNVITAAATLGLKKGEGKIITNNLVVSLVYCLLAGLIAFLFLV